MLEYNIQGKGPVVIFLHGWGGNLESFGWVAKKVAEQGHKTLNISFAGHGASAPPTGVWGIDEHCGQLLDLMDNLGIATATLVGHSFGGRAAIWMAANRPERVDKIVLVNSAGIKPKLSLKKRFRIWRYKRLKARGKNVSKFGSNDYKYLDPNLRAAFVKIVNEDLTPLLPQIAAPALLVWGTRDKDTPMYMAKKLLRGIKDSGLVKIEGAGHWSYTDDPNTFLSVLYNFLQVTTK